MYEIEQNSEVVFRVVGAVEELDLRNKNHAECCRCYGKSVFQECGGKVVAHFCLLFGVAGCTVEYDCVFLYDGNRLTFVLRGKVPLETFRRNIGRSECKGRSDVAIQGISVRDFTVVL